MQATLRDAPERFGLYNNGITIVVHGYSLDQDGITLTEPYIVNGCQTTRTIWEVFHQRYGAGGTGVNPEIEAWKARAADGVVVAKIVRVGDSGDALLQAITGYTNSQNAVREKDFLALTVDFRTWQRALADQFDLYLEIQRGGWDSQKALQNTNPHIKQFVKNANAADLIKFTVRVDLVKREWHSGKIHRSCPTVRYSSGSSMEMKGMADHSVSLISIQPISCNRPLVLTGLDVVLKNGETTDTILVLYDRAGTVEGHSEPRVVAGRLEEPFAGAERRT